MEPQEVISRIKQKEAQAQKIIEEAKNKASSLIQEVRITKRKELLGQAQDEANREIQRIKKEFERQIEEALETINQETRESIERVKQAASKNKNKARDYILDEVLKLWQLQR